MNVQMLLLLPPLAVLALLGLAWTCFGLLTGFGRACPIYTAPRRAAAAATAATAFLLLSCAEAQYGFQTQVTLSVSNLLTS